MAFHEIIPANETATFEGYGAEIRTMQAARTARAGNTVRALHVKQHVGTVGELVVTAPDGLRAGAFAEPGQRWPVYVRFSNGSGARQADRTQDARGIALKLVGVPGQKVIPGLEDKLTQDFLFIAEPAIAFKNAAEFMHFVRAAKDGPALLLPRVFASFGFRRGLLCSGVCLRSPK